MTLKQTVMNATPALPAQREQNVSLTQYLLDHMGFLPLEAQQVCWDTGENNAAAYQAFKRSGPEGHNNHEDAAQDENHRDHQWKLQKEHKISVEASKENTNVLQYIWYIFSRTYILKCRWHL